MSQNAPHGTSVALVYPPFGPAGLPSLGLGLLSAGLKQRGHRCDTFYWNLDVLAALPGADRASQARAYLELSGRAWFPFSEWVFCGALYGALETDAVTITELHHVNVFPGALLRAEDILALGSLRTTSSASHRPSTRTSLRCR
jgi:hypothetical protein